MYEITDTKTHSFIHESMHAHKQMKQSQTHGQTRSHRGAFGRWHTDAPTNSLHLSHPESLPFPPSVVCTSPIHIQH